MKKTRFNPLLGRLAEFEMMTDGERRAAGRQAKQDAADMGFPNPCGHTTFKNSDGRKSRLALFSA